MAAVVVDAAAGRVVVAADEPAPRLRAAGARVVVVQAGPVVAVVRAGRPGRRRVAGRRSADPSRRCERCSQAGPRLWQATASDQRGRSWDPR